jgi:hypothetical protein
MRPRGLTQLTGGTSWTWAAGGGGRFRRLQDLRGRPEQKGAGEEALRTQQVRVLQDRFYLGHDVPFPIGEPRLQRRV